MVHIMTAMLKADDHTCLAVYIKSRQKAVAALLQAASATGGGAVPAGAEQHRQIQECAALPCHPPMLCTMACSMCRTVSVRLGRGAATSATCAAPPCKQGVATLR